MVEAIREGDIPGVQLRRRQRLALAPEAAWAWLTEPAKLSLWIAEQVEIEAGPEATHPHLHLSGTAPRVDPPAAPWRERGRTFEIEPPRLWVLSFERLDAGWPAATRLAFHLQPAPGGSEVDVLQQGFQRLPLSVGLTIWESYRTRWRASLARLAEIAVPEV